MLDLWRTEEENFSHCVHAIGADFTNCIHLTSLFAKELDSQTCIHIQY